MKKKVLILISSFLLFLSSCNNETSNSDSYFSEDSSSEEIIHIGGDETDEKPFEYKDTYGTLNTNKFMHNNQEIKYIINPQNNVGLFNVTAFIYDMSVENLSKTKTYKSGFTSILYTPDFYFTNTTATDEYNEYVAILKDEKYVVIDIFSCGNSYIPLNGLILATPKNSAFSIEIGDTLNLNQEISSYSYGLVNQDNARLPFHSINNYRDGNEVVLYDREYGKHTKTNSYGCEIYFKYDFEKKSFVVRGFRGDKVESGNLYDDHINYGGYIPEYGFAISAHMNATNYNSYRQGRRFSLGDEVRFENYNFNNQLENATLDKYYYDNPKKRPDNIISIYNYNGANLDKYGYTNQHLWGALEVAVIPISDYGIVVAKGRNLTCPEYGYLLSCNMDAATNLDKVTEIGSLIKVSEDNVIVNNDVGYSKLLLLEHYLNILVNRSEIGHEELFDYDYETLDSSIDELSKIQLQIKEYNDQLNKNDLNETQVFENELMINHLSTKATDIYNKAYASSFESNYVNNKSGWLFPTSSSSVDDIKQMLNHYKNVNINLIYIPVFDGCTNFNSKYVPYDQDYIGNYGEYGENNFLKAFVEEAHKLGIEVHGWTTNFHVGFSSGDKRLFNAHPEWQQVYYDGRVDNLEDEMTERDLLYFDQANPEVHQFYADFYNELLDNIPLDGFHMDYIRYAAGNDLVSEGSVYCSVGTDGKLYEKHCLSRSTGYTEYAMKDFLKTYGYSSSANMKELVKNVEVYKQWTEYRTSRVSAFVEKIYNEVTKDRNMLLSIAIVPEVEHAIANKMQDWTKWVNNGWIDILNGMHYNSSPSYIVSTIEEGANLTEVELYRYPGILVSSYYDLPPIHNIYYLEAANYFNMGAAIFDLQAIWSKQRVIYSDSNTDFESLLKIGTHRNESVTPHSSLDKVFNAFINDISQRCDNIYILNDCMSKAKKDALIKKLKSFDVNDPSILKNQLEELKKDISSYCSGKAKDRINEYIDVIVEICDIRIK